MIDLSIIIVTWNTADITLKCIQSLKKYLAGVKYEIIVIDNASTDDTVARLQKLSTIKLITNSSNLGFAKANNIAAKTAQGKYLFFVNSDIEIRDNKIKTMLHFLATHPQAAIVGPKFLNTDLSNQGSVFPPQTLLNAFKEFWLGQKAYSKYLPNSSSPLSVWAISGGALIIRHSLFKKIHGWDERYFMYFEDLEMCRQIRQLGYKIFYYPQCQVLHHHGVSGQKLANTANQWRRLIPGSKIYHGVFYHYLLFLITWTGQKLFTKRS